LCSPKNSDAFDDGKERATHPKAAGVEKRYESKQ
jgi:hypothetical protein